MSRTITAVTNVHFRYDIWLPHEFICWHETWTQGSIQGAQTFFPSRKQVVKVSKDS